MAEIGFAVRLLKVSLPFEVDLHRRDWICVDMLFKPTRCAMAPWAGPTLTLRATTGSSCSSIQSIGDDCGLMRLTPSERDDAHRLARPGFVPATPAGASHGPTWDGTSSWVSARSGRILSSECDRLPTSSTPGDGDGRGGLPRAVTQANRGCRRVNGGRRFSRWVG